MAGAVMGVSVLMVRIIDLSFGACRALWLLNWLHAVVVCAYPATYPLRQWLAPINLWYLGGSYRRDYIGLI